MIEQLMKRYFELICKDHHKSKDMHFSILKTWSHGDFQGYEVVHNGYVNECWSDPFATYSDAENFLVKKLHEWIDEEERVQAEEENSL